MTFTFTRARRQGAKLLIGLAGPTGSGKTYSALLLASGITSTTGGRVAMIDTESGRAKQYAPPGEGTFDFDYADLGPPFSPDRYLEAFEAAEQHVGEGGVAIVDSTSHEHEGPGGLLEWHDAEVNRLSNNKAGDRERYNFMAWAKPKAGRRKLINRVLQARCHVIFCFRAKEKFKPVKDDRTGKNEIVSIGWQPITGDEWPYEMTIFALLSPAVKGAPIIEGFDQGKLPLNMRSLVPMDRPLDADVGRALAEWSQGGEKESARAGQPAGTEEGQAEVTRPADTGQKSTMVTLRLPGGEERQAPVKTAAKDLGEALRGASDTATIDGLLAGNAWLAELPEDWRTRLDELVATRKGELSGTGAAA